MPITRSCSIQELSFSYPTSGIYGDSNTKHKERKEMFVPTTLTMTKTLCFTNSLSSEKTNTTPWQPPQIVTKKIFSSQKSIKPQLDERQDYQSESPHEPDHLLIQMNLPGVCSGAASWLAQASLGFSLVYLLQLTPYTAYPTSRPVKNIYVRKLSLYMELYDSNCEKVLVHFLAMLCITDFNRRKKDWIRKRLWLFGNN